MGVIKTTFNFYRPSSCSNGSVLAPNKRVINLNCPLNSVLSEGSNCSADNFTNFNQNNLNFARVDIERDVDYDANHSISFDVELLPIVRFTPINYVIRVHNITRNSYFELNTNDSVWFWKDIEFGSTSYSYDGRSSLQHVVYINTLDASDYIREVSEYYISHYLNVGPDGNDECEFDSVVTVGTFKIYSRCFMYLSNIVGCQAYNNCDDLRSSASTESCEVGLVGQFAGESYSQAFNLLFQPDSNHTSGELNNLGSISLETLDSAYCRFDNNISSVRGVGVISLWGHLSGFYTSVPGTDVPSLILYTGESRVICSWSFDDPCCPSATGFSDNIDSFNDEYLEEDLRGNCEIVIDKIVWSGFERLTDYCCDDSDCVNRPNDEIGFDGNHDDNDYDDDCICEELVVLEGKFDALISTLGVIKDSLDSINYTLQHKDFTVTVNPQITVEPCEPNITVEPCEPNITVNPSPVPVTVQPSTPTITVNPSPVPVNVQPSTPTITVEPCQPQITVTSACPDVYVNNSDLITCLNGLFKVDSDSLAKIMNDTLKVTYQDEISGDVCTDGLAKVIKDKEFSHDVICEVSRVDWVYEGFGNIKIPNNND